MSCMFRGRPCCVIDASVDDQSEFDSWMVEDRAEDRFRMRRAESEAEGHGAGPHTLEILC